MKFLRLRSRALKQDEQQGNPLGPFATFPYCGSFSLKLVCPMRLMRRYQGVSVASVEGAAAGSMDKADRTDGAERAETTLPAPIRVNSRRLGFMYFAAPMLTMRFDGRKHTEMITPKSGDSYLRW